MNLVVQTRKEEGGSAVVRRCPCAPEEKTPAARRSCCTKAGKREGLAVAGGVLSAAAVGEEKEVAV